jgi:hypothetical protein
MINEIGRAALIAALIANVFYILLKAGYEYMYGHPI